MASSQVVEIASSSPFGCVLRDSNHCEAACRESSVNSTDHHHHRTFQRNIKNFVMDLKTCIAVTADSTPNENEINSSSEKNNNNLNQNKAPKNNNPERLHCFSRSNSFIHNNNNNEISLASLISPRHSRLLDRWAARHAREMVSNLENEAELLSMDDKGMLPRTSTSSSEDSELRNLGASSLVQMWEKRLNKSSVSKPNTPTERTSLASSPTTIENANAFFDGSKGNEGHSFPSMFHDWECSDQSLSSESSVSVADIIKKLTAMNQNQSPTPSFADDNEHEGYGSSVAGSPCREHECGQQQQQRSEQNQRLTCSPRIRGRRVYNDLLQQMGNDRNGELNSLAQRGAVSKFAQKGRIQALLRLKLLQREVAAKDPSRQKSAASEVNNKQSQGSYAIMQLRERFSSGAVLRTPVQTEADNPRGPQRETANKTTQLNNSATTDQLKKDTNNQKGHGTSNHAKESTQKSVSQTKIDHNTEEARSSSDVKALHNDSHETTGATTSMTDSNINQREETSKQQNEMVKINNDETVNGEEASNQQYAETSYKETVEEEATNQNYAESSYDYDTEEEVEDIDRNCDEYNYNWISEISRPRSYWEERRQAWYKEMLENDSKNEDIRRLLERGTVSNFLSSDFRDRMDRLMESHRGTQTRLVNNQDREEDSQGLMAFLQERLQSARTPQVGRDASDEEVEERSNHDEEEEEEEDNVDEHEHEHEEEHEMQSLISGSYHEARTYSNRSSSWSYRDNEGGDDFDRVVSTSPQPYQSQPFYRDSPHCPATNHHSMELELIYDLRGQMEQLYHEISELRKSMKGCMDMQMELQQSMKQEVKTVKKEEKKPNNKGLKKGNCSICYEMKVDSVLYRCGHMCACLKCANELQWNGGKCPICRAKIVDVVRVYVDG